jgi:hypothetical protein
MDAAPTRVLHLIQISDGLWRSDDASVALVLSHRDWETLSKRWHAEWNTFMSGRVKRDGPTKVSVLADLGAKTVLHNQ